jgi:two-component system, NtrC family, nitrogen regulation sensor histidine kinase NtrY
MSAWREVARRIAHEIKNPLTPIQLSAQRLQKILGGDSATEAVKECTQTIVEHVDSIKRLANEFSNFARMPTAEFEPSDLNVLMSDAIGPFAEAHSDIVFQFIPDEHLPTVVLDKEQVRRIVINLIDNAIAALRQEREEQPSASEARIVVKTHYDRKHKAAIFEVVDTGPGIHTTQKARIFEPYFTTKKGGTGLGLAIVTSILADHQGTIRVYDNNPKGAKFIVELPLVPKSGTQRRYSSGESAA